MLKFIVRRLLLMTLTMALVSMAVFAITEAAPGNIARNVLGIQITPEQEASFLAQNGLNRPMPERYLSWLVGSDWRASAGLGMPVQPITSQDGFREWWALTEDGRLTQWKLEGETLIARQRQADGRVEEKPDQGRWRVKDPQVEIKRLTAYRQAVSNNAQLAQADRQAIVQRLDQVLAILSGDDQGQAGLLAALNEPEGKLEAMLDAAAAQKKEGFQQAARDIPKKVDLIQASLIYQALATEPAPAFKTSDLQAWGRQLSKAAKSAQALDAALSEQLGRAAEALGAGEVNAASQALESAAPALDRLTGSLGDFISNLENGDYRQAASVMGKLADSLRPLDTAQLAVLPKALGEVGKALQVSDQDLGAALIQAAENLEAAQTEAARAALKQAADLLNQSGQAIARHEAAAGARVVRTFWGVDTQNHAVRWEKGAGQETWIFIVGSGWKAASSGPAEYIPLQQGLLRGDPGVSLRTGRPVADLIFTRLRNSLVLAGLAFAIVMPLALLLGIIAGLNEGQALDRALSIGGMLFSVTPEFATGIFLILIFASWLRLVPGATVFGEKAPWSRPDMLVLPVLTLTLVELGYVLRITRASMVEVMKAPYIRTAFLKGLPYGQIVLKHAIRNALMAPITVIMLHVNWLLGGIVVVEVIFGYPGLGSYLLDSAMFKDFNAIEAGAMILVAVAVGTQLLADIIYTFLNPRIRYA